jgi:hypothetical protein
MFSQLAQSLPGLEQTAHWLTVHVMTVWNVGDSKEAVEGRL